MGRIWRCLLASAVVWLLLAGAAQAAPTAGAPPAIAGTDQQGQTLTLTQGTWTDATPPVTITDAWASCAGTTCTPISPTGLSYVLAPADVGHTIQVVETATATDGSTVATVSTPAILPLPPANTVAPAVAGTAQQGQTLTASPGTWSNGPTAYAYTWNSCVGTTCTAIPGAIGPSYAVASTDVGKTIDVSVTASNAGGAALAPATSPPTAAVLPAAPLSTARPTISGTPVQGQTLTVTQGTWINGLPAINDQWQSCSGSSCTNVGALNSPTYQLLASDVGHTIQVVETATNIGGLGLGVVAGPTAVVTATSVTSVVAVSSNAPTTNQTVTLLATVSSGSGNANPSGSLSFFDGSNGVPGCTGKTVTGGVAVTVICQASFPAGNRQISAMYSPGAGSLVVGSVSPPTTLSIGKDSTSVSLAVTKQVSLGSQAIYSATLAPPSSNSGPIEPTGSIEFLDHGQPIATCLSQPLSNLTATCTVRYSSAGSHDISAAYSGDSNFAGSTSTSTSVQVVKVSTTPPVLGIVRSTIQWSFFYHPSYTQVILLKALRIVRGTTVQVTCSGGGCPFHKMRRVRKHVGPINLLPAFQNRHLRAGTKILIRLTHPHWVGKYYSFTVRAGRAPSTNLSCLAVGRSTPGGGC